MRNLLVIDWDFFFRNEAEAPKELSPDWQLWDWGHNENMSFMTDHIWGIRAAAFERSGVELPGIDQRWRQFAARITLADDAQINFADSNMWAGSNLLGTDFDNVWLFDAHHDLYQHETLDAWLEATREGEQVRVTCEDWMFLRAYQGAQLHWRYPDWHESWQEIQNEDGLPVANTLGLDWAVDDWRPVPEEFTEVFICRSGAWVPPWHDDDFDEFLLSFNRDIMQMDNRNMERKNWLELWEAERQLSDHLNLTKEGSL